MHELSYMVAACSSEKNCASCDSKRHNTLQHRNQEQSSTKDSEIPGASSESQPGPSTIVTTSFAGTSRADSTVMLGTAVIHIKDEWGRPSTCCPCFVGQCFTDFRHYQ